MVRVKWQPTAGKCMHSYFYLCRCRYLEVHLIQVSSRYALQVSYSSIQMVGDYMHAQLAMHNWRELSAKSGIMQFSEEQANHPSDGKSGRWREELVWSEIISSKHRLGR